MIQEKKNFEQVGDLLVPAWPFGTIIKILASDIGQLLHINSECIEYFKYFKF